MRKTRTILAVLGLALWAVVLPAQATVTAFLSAGAGCNGGNSAYFTPGGPPVQVSMCVSTTSERLCGTSYRFIAENADENSRFRINTRTMAPAYNFSNALPITFPAFINTPASGDLGAGTDDNRSVAPGPDQLLATFEIEPQLNTTNSSYQISLDPRMSNAFIDGPDFSCGGVFPVTSAPLVASFAFVRGNTGGLAPTIVSVNSTNFTLGTPGNFLVVTTGAPRPTLAMSGALPPGVSFDAATGVLSGTPTVSGMFPLTFVASNGTSVTQSFLLVVALPPPIITSAGYTTFTAGTAGSFSLTATGTPPPTLSLAGSLPAGVSFNAATGILSGTPTTPGTYQLIITASNGAYATQGLTLTVLPDPKILAITSAGIAFFTVNAANFFGITANGVPPPTLTLSGTLPAGVSFNAATGLLSGTPATMGTYPLTIVASNGTSVTQGLTLVVGPGSVWILTSNGFPNSQNANQSVNFTAPNTQILGSKPITLAASSTFGLPVVFSSSTTSVCTVNGTMLSMIAAGNCTIAANQAGSGNINAAAQVTQSFSILAPGTMEMAVLTASATPLLPAVAGRDLTLSAMVRMRTPGGMVTFTENGVALAGCAQRATAMLADATDTAVATCTVAAPAAPASGIRHYTITYVYPPNHASGRDMERLDLEIPFIATTVGSAPTMPDYTGMWWAGPIENGWGMSVTQHGLAQFNVIYAYDDIGRPLWYVMPGGNWNANQTAFSGALYRPKISPFSVYDATQFSPGAPVGNATITYLPSGTATLTYTIDGISGTKSIQREVFAAESDQPRALVNDIWWAGEQNTGWGLNIAQQGRVLFPVLYTYDGNGHTTFFTVPGGTWRGTAFTGDVYSTTSSPWLGTVYNPALLTTTRVGTMTLNFIDQDNATLSSLINGVTQTKNIVRQPF